MQSEILEEEALSPPEEVREARDRAGLGHKARAPSWWQHAENVLHNACCVEWSYLFKVWLHSLVFFFVCFVLLFLGPLPGHMEIPRLGV